MAFAVNDSVLVSVREIARVAREHSPSDPHLHLARSLGREEAWEGTPAAVVQAWVEAKAYPLLISPPSVAAAVAAAVVVAPLHPGPSAPPCRYLHRELAFAGRCSIAQVLAVRIRNQAPPQRSPCTVWSLLPAPPPPPGGDGRPRVSRHAGSKGRH